MKTIILIFSLLFAFAAVGFAQSKDKATVTAARELGDSIAIRKVLDEQVAAWNGGDLDGFMEGYWKSDEMIFTSGNTVSKGWQAALDRYKRGYDTREKMGTLSFLELEIKMLGKESAMAIGRYLLERKNDKPTGRFTLVFRKIGENWRIVADHTSS